MICIKKIYLPFLIVVSLVTVYVLIPSSVKIMLNPILVWLVPTVEIGIVILVIYSIVSSIVRAKKNNADGKTDFLETIKTSLEPKIGDGFVLGAILTELSVLYYSLMAWFKKPTAIDGKTFTYHKTSQIKTIVIVFTVIIGMEGVLFHYLIQLWWNNLAAWIFTILNIYALLYLVGLYNSQKFLPHMISKDQVLIRLGYQSHIKFNVKNIDSIHAAKAMGGLGEKVPTDTYLAVLLMDSPQYEILLKEPVLMKGAYGRKRHVKTVVFRADEPNEMIDQINLMRNQISSGKLDS